MLVHEPESVPKFVEDGTSEGIPGVRSAQVVRIQANGRVPKVIPDVGLVVAPGVEFGVDPDVRPVPVIDVVVLVLRLEARGLPPEAEANLRWGVRVPDGGEREGYVRMLFPLLDGLHDKGGVCWVPIAVQEPHLEDLGIFPEQVDRGREVIGFALLHHINVRAGCLGRLFFFVTIILLQPDQFKDDPMASRATGALHIFTENWYGIFLRKENICP